MSNYKDPNYFGEIIIPFNIVVISLLFAGILTFLNFRIHKTHKEYKDILPFAINTFATTAGASSAYYAYKSLRQAPKDKKQQKAYHLIERWNSPEMLALEVGAKQMIDDIKTSQQSVETYIEKAENINERYKATKVLNFFVEIAICIENEIADEAVLKSFFEVIVRDYCNKFHELIYYRRQGNGYIERYQKLVELKNKWNGSREIT